ncbi:MAG: hypothetical protein JXA90_10265 [Planctomycetes bacterium]|nr:hypothetical protein [Planctomycetota bacterium]
MNQRVYKFKPGQCTCLLGDPYAGAVRVPIRKISGSEAVLDPSSGLRQDQFVYTTVELEEGPSIALSGLVVGTASQGILLQWMHSDPREADRVNTILEEYDSRSPPSTEEVLARDEELQAARESHETLQEGASARQHAPEYREDDLDPEAAEEAEAARHAGAGKPRPPRRQQAARPSPAGETRQPAAARGLDPGAPRSAGGAPPETASTRRAVVADNVIVNRQGSRAERRPPGPQVAGAAPPATPRALRAEGSPPGEQTGSRDAGATPPGSRAGAGRTPSGAARDGPLDVDATIRSRSQTMKASALAARLKTVQVIQMEAIKKLINEAVDESSASLATTLAASERTRLLEEAEEAFRERLERFQAEKTGLEARTRILEEQLDKAQRLLEEERLREIRADQFTLSDAGVIELETKLERLLGRVVLKNKVAPEVEGDLRRIVATLLDEEREKIRQKTEEAQSGKIELLEKKIARLARTLDIAEKEREKAQRRAQALESSGISFRSPLQYAGIEEDDPAKERKLGLLKQLFDLNLELRRELEQAGRLPHRSKPPPPRERPEGSAPEAPPAAMADSARCAPEAQESPPAAEQEPREDGEAVGAPAEGCGADEEDELKTDLVPDGLARMLAAEDSGSAGADPDDLPWEPADRPETGSRQAVEIRRPGAS